MKKITTKQLIACYMINVDKFRISEMGYYKYLNKVNGIIQSRFNNVGLEITDFNDIATINNTVFEQDEEYVYLKSSYGKRDLYNLLDGMSYDVLSLISGEYQKEYSKESEILSL